MTKTSHLARLNAPKSWPIKRKVLHWITAPKCGPHSYKKSIPLKVMLTEMLNYTRTTKETKLVLHRKGILVNKKARKDPKFPIGIMDVIEVPATKEYYRVLLDHKGRLMPYKISQEDAMLRPAKIIGKHIIKNKKLQIVLFDGTIRAAEKDTYNVGDTILLDMQNNTVKGHLKFEKGALVYITGGKQVGKVGTLKEEREFKNMQPNNVIVKTKEGELETRKDYAFVVGEKELAISIPE